MIDEKLATIESKIDKLSENVSEINKNISGLVTLIRTVHDGLDKRITTVANTTSALEMNIQNIHDEIFSDENGLSAISDDLTELTKQVKKINDFVPVATATVYDRRGKAHPTTRTPVIKK